MRKITILLFIALIFSMNSCKEDADKYLYDGDNYVSFVDASSDFTAIGGETNVFSLVVGVTDSESSKTYTVEIDTDASSGIEGTHFTVDTKTVSIAAGSYTGEIEITPIFDDLPDEGIEIVFDLVIDNEAEEADYSITTHTMAIGKFCAVDDFSGDYTGTAGQHAATVVVESTGIANQYRIYGLAEFINRDWGENWIAGDGSCVMDLKCANVISIADQWIGDTDYPDTYNIFDVTGTYDDAAFTLTITYDVTYMGDPATTVLTRGAKSSETKEPFTGKKIK